MTVARRMLLSAGALVIAGGVSIGVCSLMSPRNSEAPTLPSTEDVAAKLDAVAATGPITTGREDSVSGDGPVPSIIDPHSSFEDTLVSNTVLNIAEDGPDRAVVTRTIQYQFPNGNVTQTDPGTVPFVLEPDGQWRVDREYLCRTVRMLEDINRRDGFVVDADPGCV